MISYAVDDQMLDYRKELPPHQIVQEPIQESYGFKDLINKFKGKAEVPENIQQEVTETVQQIAPENVPDTSQPTGFNALFEAINKRRKAPDVGGSPSDKTEIVPDTKIETPVVGPSKLSPLIESAEQLDDSELLKAVGETFTEDIGLKFDTADSKGKNKELPEVKIGSDSESSDDSMKQYFPKKDLTPQEVTSG